LHQIDDRKESAMLYQTSADGPQPPHDDRCVVRARHPLGLRSRVVYEALCMRGDKIEVLAATHKAAEGSAEAANALRNLRAMLRHDGWERSEEPGMEGPDVVACYIRRRNTP
jgi:hypothetical protein